jgi:hypothetical protein
LESFNPTDEIATPIADNGMTPNNYSGRHPIGSPLGILMASPFGVLVVEYICHSDEHS